jgi:hypothetical protein
MTIVINKHHYGGRVPPDAVDIMRGSDFGNPYTIDALTSREQAIASFRVYLWRRMRNEPAFASKVRALHGRRLCCCCAPLPCHGDVLARAAAYLALQPAD